MGAIRPTGVWEKVPSEAWPVTVKYWEQPQRLPSWVEYTHQWGMHKTEYSPSLKKAAEQCL